MSEQRSQKRNKIPLKVELNHPTAGSMVAVARDMSDAGVFLLTEQHQGLAVGDLVTIRSKELGINGDQSGQLLKMRIVRREPTGVGLILLEDESQSLNLADPSTDSVSHLVQQSLLLVFRAKYLLLRSQGDHWRLPSYPLAHGIDWRSALQHNFSQLLAATELAVNPAKLRYVDYCYPQTNPHSECMDLLVPAYFAADSESSPPQPACDFAWFTLAELEELNSPADKAVIDKVLTQGLELP